MIVHSKSPSPSSRFLTAYSAFLACHPLLVFLAACAVTAVAISIARGLELRSDFSELLPDSYRSVQDLHRLVGRVGGVGNLVIAVECDDLKASERFTEDLVARLHRNLPPNFVRYVDYKVDEEKAFYERNKYLYADLEDLEDIRDRFEARIQQEKVKLLPGAISFDDSEGAEEKDFDLSDIDAKYRSKTSKFDKYTDGYFVGENGRLLAILLKPYGTSSGIDFSRKLVAAVEREIEGMRPTSYHPSMKVGLTGKYRTNIDQYQSVMDDILSTTAFTVTLVLLSIYAFYRTAGAFWCLGVAVCMGAAWAFALTYLHIGYLNSQTAFLGSIIVGNGINYGIIFMARYQEERRSGAATAAALTSSIQNTILATATASLATCVSFGTLIATKFKGFNQFGFIGGFGMVLCWLASFTVLPACVVLYERVFLRKAGWAGGLPRRPLIAAGVAAAFGLWAFQVGVVWTALIAAAAGLGVWAVGRSFRGREAETGRMGLFVGPVAWAVERHPRGIVTISLILLVTSAGLVLWFIPNSFEYDFSKLLQGSRAKTEAELLKGRVNAIFGESLTPAVILADRLDQVQAIQAEVLRKRDAEPKNDGIIDNCKCLFDYLPKDQDRKLAVLRDIRDMMTDNHISLLRPDQRPRAVESRGEIAALRPVTMDDIPSMVKRNFEELDGTKGMILYVYPKPGAGLWDGRRLIRFAEMVRETRIPSGETIYTSGEAVIFADMLKAVAHDAPRAALVSIGGVLLLLLITFRNLRASLLVMASLLGGVVMMGGGMALFGVKLTFFNFVVIPITIGIAVDYAVNIYQRYRLEGPGSVGYVIRRSGGAVALCSLTTIIGYCALIIAHNAALTSFGWMANMGEFTCLFTALFSVPAYILVTERRNRPEQGPAEIPMAVGE